MDTVDWIEEVSALQEFQGLYRKVPVNVLYTMVYVLSSSLVGLTMTPIDHRTTEYPQGSPKSTSGARYISGIHQSWFTHPSTNRI